MLFTEPLFLFYFLPLALLLHRWVLGRNVQATYPLRAQAIFFSLTLVFYGFNAAWWIYPFCLSIGFDFLWAYLIERSARPGARKFWLVCSIAQNVGLLCLFKYWGIVASVVAQYSPPLAEHLLRVEVNGVTGVFPPGISFYTFESLSFVIDVYRGQIRFSEKPYRFFAFVGMFPRFIAGPIVRYPLLMKQMDAYSGMQIEAGLKLFVKGLFLKCCFADSFEVFAKLAFDLHETPLFFPAWTGVLSYTLQLYLDFSGYSLMAIGLGLCFGFQFPENFRSPYLATSLQDFWRRWHMSLSSWMRDYIYLPLGGSRRGPSRTHLNLFYTMIIAGLWHGTELTLLLWGAWHGSFLILERVAEQRGWIEKKTGWLRTFSVVVMGWVLFRSSSMEEVSRIGAGLFSLPSGFAIVWFQIKTHLLSATLCVWGLVYCFGWENPQFRSADSLRYFIQRHRSRWEISWGGASFLLSIGMSFSRFKIPFLYYQF